MVAPLGGLRVIEVATFVAAPAAATLLADMGADVVKVEAPGGDPWRHFLWDRQGWQATFETNHAFDLDNRGKRSITVDISKPEGAALVRRLCADADIFVTNLIPERRERVGLSPEALHEVNPRLIYASLTGYGDVGPEANRLGFDHAAFWARSGIMGLMGEPPSPPPFCRNGQGDHSASLALLSAILVALRTRDLTGDGQHAEVNLQAAGMWTIGSDIQMALTSREQPRRYDRRAPWNPIRNTYRTRDGRWIVLGMSQGDRFWGPFTEMAGRPDWADDPGYASIDGRGERTEALTAEIEELFAGDDFETWTRRLDEHGMIWAPVAELPEVIADPQAREAGTFCTIDDPVRGPIETLAAPLKLKGADIGPAGPVPQAGQHTEQILAELQLGDEEIADLAAAGVFG